MADNRNIAKESLVSIGEKLKSARERKALTMDQVQKDTKIHSTVLRALEEGRCDEILTPTYVKSFLNKYSHHLGLESKTLLNEYAALHPDEAPAGAAERSRQEVKGLEIVSKSISIISFALVLIAFISLIALAVKRMGPAIKRQKAKQHSAALPAKTNAPARPTIAKKKPQSKTSIPKREPFTLMLKIKSPVLVGVKKDGVLLYKRVMPMSAMETLNAMERIDLYIAKAEAIELTLNGKYLGSPGKGVGRNLEVTSNGIRIRQ